MIVFGLSNPSQTPATSDGVTPMNQTSALSLVVPVFPAMAMFGGTRRRAAAPVPRSAASRKMSRTMNATRGSITCRCSGTGAEYTRCPARSSMRVMYRGDTALPFVAKAEYAATKLTGRTADAPMALDG